MFPFIGIQADEEPKTPISASGLYNSSDTSSLVNASFSQDLLSGLSEFTFMCWAYIDATSGTLITTPYRENTAIGLSSIVIAGSGFDYIFVSLKNSNGGTTSLTADVTIDYQDWFHVAVTGSVLNGRVRAYYNGVLIDSATMTYSNATATSNELPTNNSVISLSQYNVYDRELTETEVAEHYVYDDDTMSSGVLGWDAMTPAQRSGLIYSSSFTDDISISGNEFNDKSGSGITISSTPSLTGEQIYFYTNASDLPSDTTIYNVNSATLNGTSQGYLVSSTPAVLNAGTPGKVWHIRAKTSVTSNEMFFTNIGTSGDIVYCYTSTGAVRCALIKSGGNQLDETTINSFGDDNWHLISMYWRDKDTLLIYVDGVLQTTSSYSNGEITSLDTTGDSLCVGYREWANDFYFSGEKSFFAMYSGTYSDADFLDYYNSGIALCLDSVPVNWVGNALGFWNLATWTGSNEPTTDQTTNGNNLTPVNAPTYTDQGLQVECTS